MGVRGQIGGTSSKTQLVIRNRKGPISFPRRVLFSVETGKRNPEGGLTERDGREKRVENV